MKRQLILLGMLIVTVSSFGQGLINFINYDPWNGVSGRVTRSDGTLAGPEFLGQLYAAPRGGSLRPIGVPVPFIANGILSGGTVEVPLVEPGAMADVQLRSWCAASGPSYEAAGGPIGQSNVITITLGGGIYVPAQLVGLQPTQIYGGDCPLIREPSTWALMVLGMGVLALRCRRQTASAVTGVHANRLRFLQLVFGASLRADAALARQVLYPPYL